MDKNRRWHGVDSNRISLFEYGFLMRWNGYSYDVVYKQIHPSLHQEDCVELYHYADFDLKDWIKRLVDTPSDFPCLNQIANYVGSQSSGKFIVDVFEYPVLLLNSLLHYHGPESIFGTATGGYTEEEIRKRLTSAL